MLKNNREVLVQFRIGFKAICKCLHHDYFVEIALEHAIILTWCKFVRFWWLNPLQRGVMSKKIQVIINPASGENEPVVNVLNDVFQQYDVVRYFPDSWGGGCWTVGG